jgi:hypothetical protein
MTSTTTVPLKRFILTAEGWLVIAFNAVIAAASIFGSLPGVQAVKYAAIVNAVTMFSRQGLKAITALSPVLGTPIAPDPADPVLEMLNTLERAQTEFQNKPGIPAERVEIGLAPSQGPVAS